MKIDSLAEVPNFNFEGYVWFSDKKSPEVIDNKPFTYRNLTKNPFIIEALLWAEDKKTAIHILHTDKYLIHQIEFEKLPTNAVFKDVSYLPHRLHGVKKVKFKQLWLPEPDPLCENMKVLKMKAQIFVGFEQ